MASVRATPAAAAPQAGAHCGTSSDAGPSHRRTGVRVACALLVIANVAVVAHLALGLPPGGGLLWNTYLYDGVYGAAALMCLARAWSGRDRLAWAAAGLALCSFLAGEIYWEAALAGVSNPPFPTWADIGYLAFYPLICFALVRLVRARTQRIARWAWVDGAVAGLALASVVATVVLDPVVTATGGGPIETMTNLAYPILDVLLMALLAGCTVLVGRAGGRMWLLLALALLVNGATNTVYYYQAATGSYSEGGWLNAGWPLGAMLLALAAWSEPARAPSGLASARGSRATSERLMWVFAVVVVAMMVLDSVYAIPLAAYLILTLAVFALLVRLGLALRERGQLAIATGREARTDELTRLPNRRRLYEAADAALAAGRPVAMLLLDLNRFKELNDTLGHNAGDDLLRLVARRLEPVVPDAGMLARMGGDEFTVMLVGVATEAEARAVAAALRDALEEPFPVDGLRIPIGASIGIGLAPLHATERTELLRCADVAMYRAKTRETGVESYNADGDGFRRGHLEMIGELRDALADDQLVLHYQPKYALPALRLVGVEALVRWQHPRHGLLAPGEFIWLAEREGLMRRLTLVVLERALAQQHAWRRMGRGFPVAVNLSASSLLDARLPHEVEALMRKHGTRPGELELEITEGTLMRDPARALDVMARIGELGVTFSLDDFGTGYSSLAQLRRLPVRYLKIDRSFIEHMDVNEEDASIVRSTIELAHSLGLLVVAEGVEHEAHVRQLTACGCDVAQGFHLGRPVPSDRLAAIVMGDASAGAPSTSSPADATAGA